MHKISKLTPEQQAAMAPFADEWIAHGLRTGPANRVLFEDAVRRYYHAAGLKKPRVVVWVQSPIVGALAAPIAGYLLNNPVLVDGAVRRAVNMAVHGAVDGAVGGGVGEAGGGWVGGWVGGWGGRWVGRCVRR